MGLGPGRQRLKERGRGWTDLADFEESRLLSPHALISALLLSLGETPLVIMSPKGRRSLQGRNSRTW